MALKGMVLSGFVPKKGLDFDSFGLNLGMFFTLA